MDKPKEELLKSRKDYSKKAYQLIRGLAAVGIIALVDEATVYQDVRVRAVNSR